MTKENVQQLLSNESFRKYLYARGFLFTNRKNINANDYPFYGLWKSYKLLNFPLYVSPLQKSYVYEYKEGFVILVGHAYNPFTMEYDENIILQNLIQRNSFKEFISYLNQLTGNFIIICGNEKEVSFVGDASGMQTIFYSIFENCYYISSHTNLINDFLNVKWDEYVKRLVSYRYFKLLGNYLPGNLTQFKEVHRLVPNHYVTFSGEETRSCRFYYPHKVECSESQICDTVSDILHKSLMLITKKWLKPAISLTGGCDSKTTLACANGLYDKFQYFSYISNEAEEPDANAARKICEALKLPHILYKIPDDNSNVDNVVETGKLLRWNTGDIRDSNPNDIRKRCVLSKQKDFDVEVKSWVSEIGRAYYSKRFAGKTDFGSQPTARVATTLYKFFLFERGLVKETDRIFDRYFKEWFARDEQTPVEWQEQFFWEFRVSAWNGLVITGEHQYAYDITIPYNNRLCLESLLSVPIEERLSDSVYQLIRNKMNDKIDVVCPTVRNLKHTSKRAKLERLYYKFNTECPF